MLFSQIPQATPSSPLPSRASFAPPASYAKPIHGEATWYGPGLHRHKTTSGERFNPHRLTAASSILPLGSIVEVKNLRNGRSVEVRINDCDPNLPSNKIDLSGRAANQLKMKHSGVAPVEIKVLHEPPNAQPCASR